MKKILSRQLWNLLILSLMCLIWTGCETPVSQNVEEEMETELKSMRLKGSSCEAFEAPVVDNQLIIRFSDQLNNKQILKILNKLEEHKVKPKVYTCDCSNIRLAMVEFPEGLSPEQRRRIAADELGNEGNGALFDNLEISLPALPGTYTRGGFQGLPNPSNAVVVAMIDGGLSGSNYIFYNYLWTNPTDASERCRTVNSDHGYDFTLKYGGEGDLVHPHGSVVGSLLINPLPDYVNLRLMDLRIFDKNGKGSLYDALCAIQFAIDNGADIINMSWGYYNKNAHPLLDEYMQKIIDHKIIAVTSAGNEGIKTDECLHHPSYFNSIHKNVIAVAALDAKEVGLAEYSNYGMNTVGIAAKGTHTVVMRTGTLNVEGTSYSAPEVVKAAAILMTRRPHSDFLQVTDCILSSAVPLGIEVQTQGKLREPVVDCY
jgi:Subtilase family